MFRLAFCTLTMGVLLNGSAMASYIQPQIQSKDPGTKLFFDFPGRNSEATQQLGPHIEPNG